MHQLWFSGTPAADASLSRWVKPVRTAWPTEREPHIRHMAFDQLLRILEGEDLGENVKLPAALLIFFGVQDRDRTIDRVVEGLLARNLPAVCIMPDPGQWRGFQRHGIIFEKYETDPALIAAMAFALAERQPAVELLAREIYVTQRCHGGIRLEIDRLHEELHMAAAVQREFLPSGLPSVAGMEFGLVFRPVNYVSGDIYDIEPLDDDHVGFFIADAVGHGVPAALLTLMLRNSLNTIEPARAVGDPDRIIAPAEVLRRLNSRLCQAKPGGGRFATAVYGVVENRTGKVTLAGAGHPHPLVMGAGAKTRSVETEGPLLGVFPDGEFNQVEFHLGPGRTLLLYTDGLECAFPDRAAPERELKRANKRYMQHLTRLLAGDDARSPSTMMSELALLLDEQAGSLHQADDVTAIAIAPTGEAEAARRAKAA